MSKRSKNKHRTPRRVDPLGGLSTIARKQVEHLPLATEQQSDIELTHWLSFDNLTKGQHPTAHDWANVTSAINLGLLLAELGYGYDEQPLLQRAQPALALCAQRGERTGIWRFNGADIECIRIALELHDEQLKLCTDADITASLKEQKKRIMRGQVYELQAA